MPYVLPGHGFVLDYLDPETNQRSVIPLVGWLVDDAGECHVLPRSVDTTKWVCRPQTEGDAALIRQYAMAMQPKPNHQQKNWSIYR